MKWLLIFTAWHSMGSPIADSTLIIGSETECLFVAAVLTKFYSGDSVRAYSSCTEILPVH